MDLTGDIGAAVDRAATDLGSGTTPAPATPAPASTPVQTGGTNGTAPALAKGSPPLAPAAGSGVEPAPTTTGKTQAPATAATDDDGEIVQGQDWLNLEKRRTILKNARQRERSAILESELGIPNGTNLQSVRTHLHALATNPVEYHRQLGESLRRRGLSLGDAPAVQPAPVPVPAAPVAPRARPEPDLVFADGRRAYSESAQADLMEWQRAQLQTEFRREMEERFGPLQETHDIVRQQAIRAEAHEVASSTLAQCKTWHRFDEFAPLIADEMARDRRVTVFSAYNRLLQEKLKDERSQIQQETRTDTLNELNRRPGASIVPGPGAPVVEATDRKKGGSLDDMFTSAVSRAITKHAGS